MPYKHITKEDRVKIETLLNEGYTNGYIADLVGKNRSSIGREIARNGGRNGYRSKQAEKRRKLLRVFANKERIKLVAGNPLAEEVERLLKAYWSPEQIAGRMKQVERRALKQRVSMEIIYRYLHHKDQKDKNLIKYLRCQKGKYRRRRGTKIREKRREELKKKRIDTRPKTIDERKRLGDFEGDTIVGTRKETARILTHVDRKSGYLLANKLASGKAKHVRDIAIEVFRKLPTNRKQTITYDNGSEFSDYEIIERDTQMTVYFAYPYHSWERGTNENTNGLLRQFFPKGTSLKPATQIKIDHAVKLINARPRKRLGYRTPGEVFNQRCCSLT